MLRALSGIALAVSLCCASVAARPAGLALVLAIDVSASVTPDAYFLQHEGIARAFENPRLVNAIGAMPGGIEVLVLEWSDPDKIQVTVDWRLIAEARGARAVAAAVRASSRSSRGLTAIGPALLAAAEEFGRLPEQAAQRVIDVSGNGIANFGVAPSVARDRVAAMGITINGLAILGAEPWLESYYRRNVIGGPGAFVVAARDFDSFAEAILRKLVQEVAGRKAADLAQMQ
jgi:hypothetical protein